MAGALKVARGIQQLTSKLLAKFCVLVLILSVLLLIRGFSAFAQTVVAGGLSAPALAATLGPNIVTNGNFAAGTSGWTNLAACCC